MHKPSYNIRQTFTCANISTTGPYHRYRKQKDSSTSDDSPPDGILLEYSAFSAEVTLFSKPGCFYLCGHFYHSRFFSSFAINRELPVPLK